MICTTLCKWTAAVQLGLSWRRYVECPRVAGRMHVSRREETHDEILVLACVASWHRQSNACPMSGCTPCRHYGTKSFSKADIAGGMQSACAGVRGLQSVRCRISPVHCCLHPWSVQSPNCCFSALCQSHRCLHFVSSSCVCGEELTEMHPAPCRLQQPWKVHDCKLMAQRCSRPLQAQVVWLCRPGTGLSQAGPAAECHL